MKKWNLKNRTRLFVTIYILAIVYLISILYDIMIGKYSFTLVRIIVFILGAVAIYLSIKLNDKKGIIFFTAIAAIFNPIIPLYTYSIYAWKFFDFITIIFFFYAINRYLEYTNTPEIRVSQLVADSDLSLSFDPKIRANIYLDLAIQTEKDAEHLGEKTKIKRYTAALILYRKALENNANILQAYISIGKMTTKYFYCWKNIFGEVLEDLNDGIELFPDEPELYKLRARTKWFKIGEIKNDEKDLECELIDGAISDISEYLKTNEQDEYCQNLKGAWYFSLEKCNPALAQHKMSLESGNDNKQKWMEYYLFKKEKEKRSQEKYERFYHKVVRRNYI